MTPEEKKLVGGSDASAIVGLNPYRTAIDVWRRCMGDEADPPNPKILRRGQLIEPVIRSMAADEFALDLQGPRNLRDPKRPHLRMSLDDVNRADVEEVVEFKSVNDRARHSYADGAYPMAHECQCQVYMAGLGAPRARLIALIGVDDLRQHVIEADAELQAMLLDAIDRFWADYVLTGTPPPPDSSEGYTEWLSSRYPESKGTLLAADNEAELWARVLREAKAAKAEAEKKEREARNWLQAKIAENEGIQGEGWKVTFKSTKGRESVDWEAVCMAAEVPPSIIKEHTKRTPFRTFRSTFKGSPNVE